MPLAITLLGGSPIFAAFLVIFLFAVTFSLYTKRGSGISQRPYNKQYGGAPGASVPSSLSHDRAATNWISRTTKS
jgi:hypothetical protein